MKKARNTFLLALALLSVVSMGSVAGTYAKYTSTQTYTDTARVAKWDIESGAVDNWDLFADTKNQSNLTDNKDAAGNKVIAPGSTGTADFKFTAGTNTEVDYTVKLGNVKVTDNIGRITYTLKENGTAMTDAEDMTAAELKTALEGLTFNTESTYTIEWIWAAGTTEADNTADTALGNAETPATVTISADITATQTVKP